MTVDDPFAQRPVSLWERLNGSGSPQHAPKRVAKIAAMLGPTVALMLPHLHNVEVKLAFAVLLFVVPSMLVERYWKQRHRREQEQLFPPWLREQPSRRMSPAIRFLRSR